MKKTLTLLAIIFNCVLLLSQVGINTPSPTNTLDVNGDLRIRSVTAGAAFDAANSILVSDATGIVRKVTAGQVFSGSTGLISYVRGELNGTPNLVSVGGVTGWQKVPFNSEIYDSNGDYDNTTNNYVFTTPKNGLYEISAQVEFGGALTVGTSYGMGIFKQIGSGTPTLLIDDTFSHFTVSIPLVATVGITPQRKVHTTISLNTGDKIFFAVREVVGLSALAADVNSFFNINQVK